MNIYLNTLLLLLIPKFYAVDESFGAPNAAVIAVKGHPFPLDLSYIETSNQYYYSFLSFAWGIIADIDVTSEPLRFLGETRFIIAAAYHILKQKMYSGRLSLYTDAQNNLTQLPPLCERIDEGNGWEIIESDFSMIWVLQTSHASSNIYSGPNILLDDGLFTILIIKNTSIMQMFEIMLALERGEHISKRGVEVHKTKAYRLEPVLSKHGNNGIFTIDGEACRVGPIQGIVLPAAARILK